MALEPASVPAVPHELAPAAGAPGQRAHPRFPRLSLWRASAARIPAWVSSLGTISPRSQRAQVFQWTPTTRAASGCDHPRASRSTFSHWPNFAGGAICAISVMGPNLYATVSLGNHRPLDKPIHDG
jgi:hypothetical protein